MDLAKEKTICLNCKHFLLSGFLHESRTFFKCLLSDEMFHKLGEKHYKDSEGNTTKLPVVEECSQFSAPVKTKK